MLCRKTVSFLTYDSFHTARPGKSVFSAFSAPSLWSCVPNGSDMGSRKYARASVQASASLWFPGVRNLEIGLTTTGINTGSHVRLLSVACRLNDTKVVYWKLPKLTLPLTPCSRFIIFIGFPRCKRGSYGNNCASRSWEAVLSDNWSILKLSMHFAYELLVQSRQII